MSGTSVVQLRIVAVRELVQREERQRGGRRTRALQNGLERTRGKLADGDQPAVGMSDE